MSDLIKLDAAAKRLTISRRTLDRLIAAGEIKKVRVSPDRYAIDSEEIDRYIARSTQWASDSTPNQKVISCGSGDAESRLLARLNAKPTRKLSTTRKSGKS